MAKKKQALSVSQMLQTKYQSLELTPEWELAFGTPEAVGTWLVWGNSGNGKTTFAMMLAKELSRHGVVLYNSLEEGQSLTLANTIERCNMMEVNGRVRFISEDMETLTKRLQKPRSPKMVIIDSFQYTMMNYKEYLEFKSQFPNHLLIFISHADGRYPSGRSARSVMYDASLKIMVQAYRAFSKGRFIGERGWINIWEEEANAYWGVKQE